MEFSAATRAGNLGRLQAEEFDLLVIGGGITGAGIARDAALRGFRTALIEQGDYASGTSSRSSKLIHGGLRYLENLQFRLVFEASSERRVLRRIAPHLLRPLPFLLPIGRHRSPSYSKLRAGMWLYDALSLFRNIQLHRMLGPRELLQLEPWIRSQDLVGGARFYDCGVDDARLTLATILSAHQQGAVLVNQAQVCGLLKAKGKVRGVQVRDQIAGTELEVRARLVVNAAGPWSDRILQLDDPRSNHRLRPSKGIHLVISREKIGSRHAVVFTSHRDDRVMFVIPWGAYLLIGTTDTDYSGELDQVYADADDVAYVLGAFNRAFSDVRLTEEDILSTYAGLRPLAEGGASWSYRASREHQILESGSGLLSIIGGKLTTYRIMARQVVDGVARRLARESGVRPLRECETDRRPLAGGTLAGMHVLLAQEVERAVREQGIKAEGVAPYLIGTYGVDYGRILELVRTDPSLGRPIVPGLPYLWAEVPHAVRYEMALTLSDFMIRRTHLLFEEGRRGTEPASQVAALMARHLGWEAREMAAQVEGYRREVALTQRYKQ